MGIIGEIMGHLEFEGSIVGGKLTDDGAEDIAKDDMTEKQKEDLDSELKALRYKIADTFDNKEHLLKDIELQAKLRILIQKRMKEVKKIPKEYVDKYNEVVTRIRDTVKAQAEKERSGGEE